MGSVHGHYEKLLGPVYGWMVGDFASAVAEARAELETLRLSAGEGDSALDLGAGNGVYAVALADMGFRVIAIDSCAELLGELRENAGSRPVGSILGDLTAFPEMTAGPFAVIACVGDTLPHLESEAAVRRLFEDAASSLAPGGVFLATFRDYTTELEGENRFIPVRADDDRILTCFLEYHEDLVLVHDILQQRTDAGWETVVSAYPKLRLDPARMLDSLHDAGLEADIGPGARGMLRLVGRRGA